MREYPIYALERILDLKQLADYSSRRYEKKEAYKMLTGRSESVSGSYGQSGNDLSALSSALFYLGFSSNSIAFIKKSLYRILSYIIAVNSNMTVIPLNKEKNSKECYAERCETAALFTRIIQGTAKTASYLLNFSEK